MADQFLSQDEVDALLEPSGQTAASPLDDAPQLRVFDGARLDRIGRRRMRALETIHRGFARKLRESVAEFLRCDVELQPGPIAASQFDAFAASLSMPSSLNVVRVRPLQGNGLVVLDAALISLVVERLFGGSVAATAAAEPARELSQTEQRLAARLLQIAVEDYRAAWSGFYPLQLEPVRAEAELRHAAIALPADIVVTAAFTLRVGEASGTLRLAIPYATLEPIRETLFAPVHAEPTRPDRHWVARLSEQLQDAEIELSVELGQSQASVAELMALKPGDFVELDLNETVVARVGEVALFECRFGTSNGRYAIRIHEFLGGNRPRPADASQGNRK
ncbi:MAG TPA: flagellar motor switch protein FliM [Burkholderiaceae bacterium]|nr:flagellar motor switch protein FliM [Burkholderiaceae bacterium]